MMRVRLLTFCSALWGLATAMTLLPRLMVPAPVGQLPGFATSNGFDAHAPFHFYLCLAILPLLFPFLLRPVTVRLASVTTRVWAANGAALSMTLSLWIAMLSGELWGVLIPAAAGVLLCFSLRRFEPHFTRRDLILVPAVATLFLALIDLTRMGLEKQLLLAIALALAVRLILVVIHPEKGLAPSFCFALSPLATLLQSHFLSYDQRHMGWPPLLLATLTPFLMRMLFRNTTEIRLRVRRAVTWIVFPLAALGYLSATSQLAAEGKPRLSFFEDAHDLVPASEVLRGETLYRDIIPTHGLLEDGLLDVLLLRSGPITIGRVNKGRGVVAAFGACAVYALATAATGSPEIGILTFFLGAMMGAAGGGTRFLPGLIALAFMARACRGRPRLLIWAGAAVIVAGLTSLEQGVYGLFTLLFAVTRIRGGWRPAGLGLLVTGTIASIAMMIGGFFVSFLRVSVMEIGTLGPVYTLTPFSVPEPLRSTFHFFPEALLAVFYKDSIYHVVWLGALLSLAMAWTVRPASRRRRNGSFNALLVICVWVIIVGLSYAERQHIHFFMVAPVLLVSWIWYYARNRWALTSAIFLLLAMAQPTTHLAITAWLRQTRGPLEQHMHLVDDPPRARGAWWSGADLVLIQAAAPYIKRLPPGQTWFDFTNRGLLYFLFDRDCPIRQVEVAFYETEDRQREVIARLEANQRVVAALMPMSANEGAVDKGGAVDHVPNATRAPLVWNYLQEHFRPDYQEGNILFWRRK